MAQIVPKQSGENRRSGTVRVRWVAAGMVVIVLLAGCAASKPATLNVELVGGAPSMEKIAFADLVNGADRIVVGEVVSAESAWNAERTSIFTTVRLRVSEAAKGAKPGEVLLRVEGGQAGGIAQVMSGGLSFADGEQVVLFIKGQSVFGGLQGVYPVQGGSVGGQTLASFLQQVRAVK